MNTPELLINWHKSSCSGSSGGNCVEIAVIDRDRGDYRETA